MVLMIIEVDLGRVDCSYPRRIYCLLPANVTSSDLAKNIVRKNKQDATNKNKTQRTKQNKQQIQINP